MSKILFVALGGVGDCIECLRHGSYIPNDLRKDCDVLCLSRDEVFHPLKLLFSDQFNLIQDKEKEVWSDNYKILTDLTKINELKKEYNEIYVICPDLMNSCDFAFDFKKYHCNQSVVRQKRLLEHRYFPENIIYFALNSSTDGYQYHNPRKLVIETALALPDQTIYFPILPFWANIELQKIDHSKEDLPKNVYIDFNPTFENSFKWLQKSCYCVCLDNGISHIAHSLGCDRLLLDPHFTDRFPWKARWREDFKESIPLSSQTLDVAKLIELNIKIPQTNFLNKFTLLMTGTQENWRQKLLFKF